MSHESRYFKVTGGAVRAAYERFITLRQTQLDARKAERDKWGATGIFANSQKIDGLLFQSDEHQEAGPAPEGWELTTTHNVWMPSKRTKSGRAIHKTWSALPIAGAPEFQTEVLGKDDWFYFADFPRIFYMTFERIGDALILHVPKITRPKSDADNVDTGDGYKWSPPDDQCVELKTSEYWALKEAQPAEAA